MNKLLIAPEGMRHLNDGSTEGMIATFRDYDCRDVAGGKIIFNRVQQKCMISLKEWVKDKVRLQEEAKFETGTTRTKKEMDGDSNHYHPDVVWHHNFGTKDYDYEQTVDCPREYVSSK